MIKILWDQGFKHIYRKAFGNDAILKKKFWYATELFAKDPFNSRLRTHKLTGRLEGLWAFSITYDCRVIFQFVSKNEVLFIDIGSRDEVY